MRYALSFLAAGLLLCLFASPLPAAGEVDGKQLLRGFLDDVQTMSADFEQSLVDADGSMVEESSGSMKISRPGRFRWNYEAPYEQLLVADGLNVWSYDADLEQVTVKPQSEVLTSTPAVLLGGGGGVLDDFRITESFTDRGTDWIRLRPVHGDGSFESVDLGFSDGRLTRMIFLDSLGQSTLIALSKLRLNEPLDDHWFTFTPPDDADLVGSPVRVEQPDS